MKKRGAVIGVGYLGNFHAQKMKALEKELDFSFVGVCDLNQSLAEQRGHELGVKAFSQFQDIAPHVDLVTIATTTPSHFEVAKFFLEQGKHVNVEKPICLKPSEAEILVRLAAEKKLILSVGHSERFSTLFSEMGQRMSQSKPLSLELHRHAPFKRRGSEVSVVFDLMIHDLDLMLSLDPSTCKLISSRTGSLEKAGHGEDWAQASFQFASGMSAMISVSRVAPAMTRTMKVTSRDQVMLGNFQTCDIEIGQMRADGEGMDYQVVHAGKSDNLLIENRNFIASCLGLEKALVTGEAGLRALHLADEVVRQGS